MPEQSVPEGVHPMEATHSGAVHEELQPVGRTYTGAVRGGLSPVEDSPHAETGEECNEEGAAETRCNKLTTIPISCPPVLLGGTR